MTAVEWLIEQIKSNIFCDHIQGVEYWDKDTLIELLEQAKKMEEEQSFTADELKAAYYAGYIDAQTNHINDAEEYVNAKRYLKSKKP